MNIIDYKCILKYYGILLDINIDNENLYNRPFKYYVYNICYKKDNIITINYLYENNNTNCTKLIHICDINNIDDFIKFLDNARFNFKKDKVKEVNSKIKNKKLIN